MNFRVELSIPPDIAFATLVQTVVTDAADRAELEEERAQKLTEAAVDGFTTIVEQAMAEAREPMRVIAQGSPCDLRIRIRERGLPLDGSTTRRDPAWQHIAGKVDAMHWHTHGSSGTELELVVSCKQHEGGEASPSQAEDVPLAPLQNYTIRRFQPSDAAAVSRAFYLTYGYHYDFPAVYEPRRLTALNSADRYISIVAIGEDGELAGHYALSREEGQPIGDGCAAIVLPAHRGRDLLNQLRKGMEEEAQRLGLAAYFSEPVTDHGRTQHASESFGAKATGITLACAPVSFLAKHMELTATTQRQSTMLYFKLLKPAEPRVIFAPPAHQEMIARIYESLEIPIELAQGAPVSGAGSMRTSVNRADAVATIDIVRSGAESASTLAQVIDDLRTLAHLGAIYLRLPLEGAGTPELCAAAEACGMFFSAVGPWMLDGKDALILQMPLTKIDLSALTVVSDFGKELLNYISVESTKHATRRSIPA